MLEHSVSQPTRQGETTTVAVLLHGRGSHRGDLQALRPNLPEDWWLVTPQAPYPGHPWGYGPGWAWYRYVEEDRVEAETLEHSLAALDAFLAGLEGIVGRAPDRVVMGGFSQGGTTSLAYALTRPDALTAALNFSGFLAAGDTIADSALTVDATPLFWGHGTRDPNIPFELAKRGRIRLAKAGVPLVTKDYEIGHWIAPEEVGDAVAVVEGLA